MCACAQIGSLRLASSVTSMSVNQQGPFVYDVVTNMRCDFNDIDWRTAAQLSSAPLIRCSSHQKNKKLTGCHLLRTPSDAVSGNLSARCDLDACVMGDRSRGCMWGRRFRHFAGTWRTMRCTASITTTWARRRCVLECCSGWPLATVESSIRSVGHEGACVLSTTLFVVSHRHACRMLVRPFWCRQPFVSG